MVLENKCSSSLAMLQWKDATCKPDRLGFTIAINILFTHNAFSICVFPIFVLKLCFSYFQSLKMTEQCTSFEGQVALTDSAPYFFYGSVYAVALEPNWLVPFFYISGNNTLGYAPTHFSYKHNIIYITLYYFILLHIQSRMLGFKSFFISCWFSFQRKYSFYLDFDIFTKLTWNKLKRKYYAVKTQTNHFLRFFNGLLALKTNLNSTCWYQL